MRATQVVKERRGGGEQLTTGTAKGQEKSLVKVKPHCKRSPRTFESWGEVEACSHMMEAGSLKRAQERYWGRYRIVAAGTLAFWRHRCHRMTVKDGSRYGVDLASDYKTSHIYCGRLHKPFGT